MAPKCPAPKRHGAELSSDESAAPKCPYPTNITPKLVEAASAWLLIEISFALLTLNTEKIVKYDII